ncbi:UTP--glucose-1-phosphate uridylyltransferase GalU [Lysinibacillus sp. HST-98]|uniref:UTP--glucose-1-phosphate uridylyltransferase GalU n=1 Tax=Lysinibacillus TaxID=400634 RepID=UPI001928D4D8|nr:MULTISPECIES: UTP--glucose-1-phosphate uridylyltransferase GalU [Lysinibacillus]MBL3730228.1 UTP--glucose-1-phosphate uridylyltransferase GalU [Lysinibacillus sp. HST-98]MBU5250751.1 UTP--glucose-1-phosphate uridylyltransferase GalU [Lysinibacillus capsici]
MKKIRKAIIPAAGLGTRFLPATKAMPKEMLPIVDKPTIQYIVEEAIASGIEDIIIVTGRNKRAIEDHFDNVFELETNLLEKGKIDILEKVQESANVEIHYIRQKEPLGLGHAIWCARKFIGEEPFAVLLGDDIVKNNEPCLKQLITQYEKIEASVIAVQKVSDEDIHRYGVIDPLDSGESLMKVTRFVEKPVLEDAPSNFAIIGRYVLTPDIFGFLDEKKIGKNGEIQLTDAIELLNNTQDVYAYLFNGQRYDVGEKLGYIETMIDFALERSDLYEEVRTMLLKKAKELKR